jgi:hypothetical protein
VHERCTVHVSKKSCRSVMIRWFGCRRSVEQDGPPRHRAWAIRQNWRFRAEKFPERWVLTITDYQRSLVGPRFFPSFWRLPSLEMVVKRRGRSKAKSPGSPGRPSHGGLMMYGVPNMKTDKVDVVQRRPAGQEFFYEIEWRWLGAFLSWKRGRGNLNPKHIAG